MQQARSGVVAAFDFDGTITRRDTLVPFLRLLCGVRAVNRALLTRSIPLGTAVVANRNQRRSGLKEEVLRELLTGRHSGEVAEAGEHFAATLGRGGGLRPETVSRWRWHREQRHRIVVVSASLEIYLRPFAAAMGGADVLGTRLLESSDGRLTGQFDGFNCRGAEKVRRLREWGLHSGVELWAYGDSAGDRELLASAHVPHRVGRGIRRAATRPGLRPTRRREAVQPLTDTSPRETAHS